MASPARHLFVPGPTNLPEPVRQAMTLPMEDMRAPDFGDLTLPLFSGLSRVFGQRTGEMFIFPSSATGAWEAAIANTLRPGDKVLMSRFGRFGALWVEMAERLGLEVICVDAPLGEGVPLGHYDRILGADVNGEIKAVFATHCETSTGVVSDIAGVRAVLDANFHDALLVVDGVSSIASMDFRMEEWGVDLAIAGSQKGFMLPPGLAFLAASRRAMEIAAKGGMRRSYFDLTEMARMNAEGQFPYTPPVQLLRGLAAALKLLEDEGMANVIGRHSRLAEGVRRGVAAWSGASLVAARKRWESDTVTAIRVPQGVDARDVLRVAYDRYGCSFGAGLGELTGRAFRIGHLGALDEGMVLTALSLAELSLLDAGAAIRPGSGVAAAQDWFRAETAQPGRLAPTRPTLAFAAE